jgi:NAD(P)-dependent dehydrogenase (short-subunit alcohol dehydrogenase family)
MVQRSSDGRLASKVALVTGGGQGIGKGIACAFASEGAGIAIVDIDEAAAARSAKECEGRGVDAIALVCDVSDRNEVDRAVAAVIERFGRLDLVVTCALAKVAVQPFESTDAARIERMWHVGYMGVVNTMQACLPHLRATRGSVINFGSGAGIGAAAGYASYAPVKEAVRAITRVAAREWGAYGVRVNAICPFARSEQFDEWAERNPDHARMAIAGAALGRVGDCERDIGRAAVFLASEDAGFVTGHSLMVDGGQGMPL